MAVLRALGETTLTPTLGTRSMDAETVEASFRQARDQGRAADIERIEASNGDVYFYSTDHLTPTRAQSLAEYDAVERAFNV